MAENDEQRERRLRASLGSLGLSLHKSRVRNSHLNDEGGYQVRDTSINGVVAGSTFELDLDEVEIFVADRREQI